MNRHVLDTWILREPLRLVALVFLRVMGWRLEGAPPDVPKCVVIAAPHTSNWDFVFTLAASFAFRMRVFWMGKHTLFRWPFGGFMRWLGGISVHRGRAHHLPKQCIQAFRERDRLVLMVPPEGTRGKAQVWKKGFHTIAKGAGVPIALGYLDYGRKVAGLGPLMTPTDDIESDMERLREFYAGVTAKYPEKACEPRAVPED